MELNGKVNKKGKRIKYAYLNSSVELTCETLGSPIPVIVWHHMGKKISQSLIRTLDGASTLSVRFFLYMHTAIFKLIFLFSSS